MVAEESPRVAGRFDVGDGTALYWEEWGHPEGVPTLYLHGGPGGGLGASLYRKHFDLERTRVVGLEQRGCGRSTPHASDPAHSLDGNTTQQLVADLERLRRHLGIGCWVVNGASWGSTLALAYARTHPDRVRGLVPFAVTTRSRAEVEWITEGVGAVFPEEAYSRLMESPDPAVRDVASLEWALWEDTHVSIGAGGMHRDARWDDQRFRHAFVRLTTHYWSHDGYCDPPILADVEALRDIPAVLVHGRRDISSPLVTAWRLHRSWPGSRLVVDEGDGHGGASMVEHWGEANDELLELLGLLGD